MTAPKVFISYSHDTSEHRRWILRLATDLQANGVGVVLDQWDLSPGQDISMFMQKGISDADRVIVVCSENYVVKAEAGLGGVGYERLILTSELIGAIDTKKFVPIIRGQGHSARVPNFLGPRVYVDFRDDGIYDQKLEEILREIHNSPALIKPPLGPNPFSENMPGSAAPLRVTSDTGLTPAGKRVLEDEWFLTQQRSAEAGLKSLGLLGSMELRFGLHSTISNKSQIQLLDAVRKSSVDTFGWPIGIILDNVEAYRPKPYSDGVRAEISIKRDPLHNRESYDYWALRYTGDFYLLQNLFEDSRSDKNLFFDTRIVRVTEALMFASRLYAGLGVHDGDLLSVRITHRGLAGRSLSSASSRHLFLPRSCSETQSVSEVVLKLDEIITHLPAHVKSIVAPMFVLFDFQEFGDGVYEDIVRKFEKGIIR